MLELLLLLSTSCNEARLLRRLQRLCAIASLIVDEAHSCDEVSTSADDDVVTPVSTIMIVTERTSPLSKKWRISSQKCCKPHWCWSEEISEKSEMSLIRIDISNGDDGVTLVLEE